jgi:hypothetical protein
MTKSQENKMSMYLTAQEVLNYHSEAWSEFQALKDSYNEFSELILRIKAVRLVQEKKITGVTKNKKVAREAAVKTGMRFADAIRTHTTGIGDLKSADRVSYRMNDFSKGRDTVVIDRLEVIYEAAEMYIADLADYRLTQDDLTEFAALIKTYSDIVEEPRLAVTNRTRATEQLKGLIKETDSVLINKLDKMVNQFETENPEFWMQYRNARKTLHLGFRKRKEKELKDTQPAEAVA